MPNQANEKGFFASNVVLFDFEEESFHGFKVSTTGKLVNERGVRWVVVFEAHLGVLIEEREAFIWVLDFFEVGYERNWLGEGFFCGFGASVGSGGLRSVVRERRN